MASLSDVSLDRGLPASVEAERSILGAILLDNHSYNEAAERLRAEDFSLDSHRRIYARMAELIDSSPRGGYRHALGGVSPAQGGGGSRRCRLPRFPHRGSPPPAEHRRVRPDREG